jgi:UDP-glucuronate 4-epimerase
MATLVTGAAGFIGFHVARALMARGGDVIGIDNFSTYYDPRLKHDRIAELRTANSGSFEFEQVDFANADVLDRALGNHDFDRIIHLGAQPGVRHSIENPLAYASANLAGHLNLLEVARGRRASQMVYASSSSVYGGNEALPFRVEDRTDHPISLYAATKRADELMSEAYAQLYRIPLTGLRFFTVYGPWGRPDMAVWDFTSRILEGRTIPLYNQGRMQRDFTYIDDIVDGVLSSHDHPPSDDGREKPGGSRAPHRLYNIGNNRPEELMRLVGLIEEACGRKAEVELLPMQPGDAPATFADISAIQADLGFSPRTPIDVGIPRFVEWYRAYRGGQ